MKKALVIVAIVTAYSLFETFLLVSTLAAYAISTGSSPTIYQWTVWWGQLIIIPGMAALLSRIMYGPLGWRRRALIILATGWFGVPASIVVLILFGAILTAPNWILDVTWPAAMMVLILVLLACIAGGIIVALFRLVRKEMRRSVQVEAARWLTERQSGINPSERRWRNRGIRWSLWFPSFIVLVVFLFLPETWGILSHLSQPQASTLPGYKVPIPLTWIIQGHETYDGRSWLTGIASRGMGLDAQRYMHADLPLSYWGVEYDQSQDRHRLPKDAEVVSRRSIVIGGENMTCLEYLPSYLKRTENVKDSSIAFIQCSGPGRLSAGLTGEKSHVPAFYRMLEGIVKTQ